MALPNIYISAIGPKNAGLGGYDVDNPSRTALKRLYESIIDLYSLNYNVIGISGLATGTEQDFVAACITKKIKYKLILPFKHQEKLWPQVPSYYEDYLAKASSLEYVSKGQYSPKKIIDKQVIIVDQSDVVIYIQNKLKHRCDLLNYIIHNNKKFFITTCPYV